MLTIRTPSLRYTFGNAAPCLRNTQRRWAQVHDVRFLVTHNQGQRVAERYQQKLQQRAKQEGYRDVEELKQSYQEKIEAQRKKALQTNPRPSPSSTASPQPTQSSSSPYPAPPSPPQPTTTASAPPPPPGIKTLSSYIDIPKTRELPQKEIEYIWRLRHANDTQSLCAVIPSSTYARIESTARQHPRFILPLPRADDKGEQGAEIHFLQWTFPTPTTATVLFTHLAEYKMRGEFAQPHTTVTHHTDLREEKELVLLEGKVVPDRGISVDEGKWLLMCLQKFYGGTGEKPERKSLLEKFSGGDGGFRVEDLLEETEKIV
ncbi:uncharacterized protein KY384_008894 [Bacidia gigantensis]|uniref:uncharacterized protein n=1 Tax=Bacidia gigantensis TaxID=2732470 RepID=UPI001D04F8DD|nr:uncharacterized protein KY384_008894 [Bacidia gigantensis]KAG8525250.1 hypothetical protein KY384_008894 [Bacidia gigantensis]